MAALLCDFAAAVEAADSAGNTPLHVSAARGHTATLQFLLEYAAAVDAQNDAGDTALHLATWFGNHECVKCLLEYDASLAVLNALGFDPRTNVLTRSPLAQKKKFPSGLRKALALIAARASPPLETTSAGAPLPPSSELRNARASLLDGPPALPTQESPSLRRSTGSLDDFHDAIDGDDDGTPWDAAPAVPADVLVALGRRAPDFSKAAQPGDVQI
jgi:hypothetical protein